MKQEAGEGKAGDPRESSAVAGPALGMQHGQVLGRKWMEHIGAWCLERLEDAWRRQYCQRGAFYFAKEVVCMEKWNILAEPIPKLQMLKLLET